MFGKIKLKAIDYISETKLPVFERGLLLVLIGLAKYKGLVFASQREVAEYANTSQSAVNKGLKSLIAHGLVIKEKDHLRIDPTFCQFG